MITRSTELSNEASALFSDVRATMEVLAQEDAEVDLSAQIAYLDKRIEALGYAVASNDALLARDTAVAVEQNDAYNAADKEAASLAAALPIDPGTARFGRFGSAPRRSDRGIRGRTRAGFNFGCFSA